MVNITQEQKELFYDGGNAKDYVFDFPEIDLKITNDIIHEQSVTIKESICEDNELKLGGCIASSIEFEVSEIMDYDLTGLQLKADLFVNLQEDGTSDLQLPMGVYRVDSCLQVNDKDYKKVVGYNAFYDASVDVSDWYNDFFADESKKTLVEMKESLLIHLGMSYIKQSLPNDSMKVEKTIEPNGKLTGTDVLRSICELNAGFGIIDRDGFFKIISLSASYSLYPEETLYPEEALYPEENSEWIGSSDGESKVAEYRDCTYEEYSVKPITCLNIKTNEDDYGVTIGTDLSNPYVISSNFLLYGKSTGELVNVGNPILYMLKEITYIPSNVKLDGLPFMECGDSFVLNKINDTVNSVVFTRKLSGVQSLIDTFESKGSEVRANEVGSNNEIVQLKGKILSIKKDVNGVKVEVSDFEKNTSTKFEQTDSAIEMEVKRAEEAESNLSSSIKVNADNIALEVERATGEEEKLSSSISMNADNITAEVERATKAEGKLSGSISVNADNITAEVKRAEGAEKNLESSINLNANQIVLKVDSDGNIVEVALGTDADDESKTVFQVGADNISLTANDVIDLLTNGTINLTGKNITITSDNFTLDKYGKMSAKAGDFEGTLNGVTGTFKSLILSGYGENGIILGEDSSGQPYLIAGAGVEVKLNNLQSDDIDGIFYGSLNGVTGTFEKLTFGDSDILIGDFGNGGIISTSSGVIVMFSKATIGTLGVSEIQASTADADENAKISVTSPIEFDDSVKVNSSVACEKLTTSSISGIKTGRALVTIANGSDTGSTYVEFANAFAGTPIITCTPILTASALNPDRMSFVITNMTSAGFTVTVKLNEVNSFGTDLYTDINWIAIYNEEGE